MTIHLKISKKVTVLFFLALFSFSIFAQDGAENENNEDVVNEIDPEVPVVSSILNDKFDIKNVTFYKKLSASGNGTELVVNFEIHNNTDEDIPLNLNLVAYRETDSVNQEMRRIVKYPAWRKKDFDKELKKIIFYDAVPFIEKSEIIDEEDSKDSFVSFEMLNRYINMNSDLGAEIVVEGMQSEEEYEAWDEDNLVTIFEPMKTTVFGKLFVPFRRDGQFFNNLGIIITDPDEEKIVYSQLFHFTKPLKVY